MQVLNDLESLSFNKESGIVSKQTTSLAFNSSSPLPLSTKRCYICKKDKPSSEFSKDRSRSDGLSNKCKNCDNKKRRKYYQENKSKESKRYAEYYKNHPKAKKAKDLVAQAVKNGILIRPEVCSICDKKGIIEGHHEDYDKPLEVQWLCLSHHRKLHRKVN